jgi:four helix bundle protein
MRKSILKDKTFEFGIQIVLFCQALRKEKKEYILYKQVLRSGTAIGALIREAEFGQSRADFISKMSIALKEANETEYWLDLMKATGNFSAEKFPDLSKNLKDILYMLIATIKTAKENK